MKKIFIIFTFIFALSLLPLSVLAQNIEQGNNVILTSDRVIDKDYFAAGNSVTLEGTVNGDAYLAGGNIVVNGMVNGDLLTAGGNIDIRGTVTGNIRAVGGNLNVNGTVGRNISLVGGTINLAPTANVNGNLTSAGGNINVSSPIGKDANLAAGQVVLSSKIGGDVNASSDQLNLTPTATISGNLTYLSRNTASIAQGATVSGKITQNIPQGREPQKIAIPKIAGILTFFAIADFILAAIIGLFLISFLPIFFAKTAGLITEKPWLSLGIGLLTVIIFPFIFILLIITIIGIPIGLLLAFVLAVFLYLSKIFVSFIIGQLILKQFNIQTHKIWPLLLGLITYSLLGFIPILGWLVSAITGLIGLGALLIGEKNYYKDLRAKQII